MRSGYSPSRIRGKVGYATKSEHDFSPPEDFERRDYAELADWQLGEIGAARIFFSDRIAWLIQRDFGAPGEVSRPTRKKPGAATGSCSRPRTPANGNCWPGCSAWRQNAEVLGPPEFKGKPPNPGSPCCATVTSTAFDAAEAQTDFPNPIRERRQQRDRSPRRSGRSASAAWSPWREC